MSLGASRADVLRMVMRNGILQALCGTLAGLVGALLLSQLMNKMLYGVRTSDPITFGCVFVILGMAALAASFVPAAKVTRVEPVIALRNE